MFSLCVVLAKPNSACGFATCSIVARVYFDACVAVITTHSAFVIMTEMNLFFRGSPS